MSEIDMKYVVNVRECMLRAYLPRPQRKVTVLVTGWNEFLRIIGVDVGRCQ